MKRFLLLAFALALLAPPARAATGLSSITFTNLNKLSFTVNLAAAPTNMVKVNLRGPGGGGGDSPGDIWTFMSTNVFNLWTNETSNYRPTQSQGTLTATNIIGKSSLTASGAFITERTTNYTLVSGTNNLDFLTDGLPSFVGLISDANTTNASQRAIALSTASEGAHLWLRNMTNLVLTNSAFTLYNGQLNHDGFGGYAFLINGDWAPTQAGETLVLMSDGSNWVEENRYVGPNGGNNDFNMNPTDLRVPYRRMLGMWDDSPMTLLSAGGTNVAFDGNILLDNKIIFGPGDTNQLFRTNSYYLAYQSADPVGYGLMKFINPNTAYTADMGLSPYGGFFSTTGGQVDIGVSGRSLTFDANELVPSSSGVVNLGTTGVQWKSLYLTNQIVWGPGTTNVLYRSSEDLIYTNGAADVFLGVVNGSGAKSLFGTTPGGHAIVIADTGKVVYFGANNNGSGDVMVSQTAMLSVNAGAVSLGTTVNPWNALALTNKTSTNYIYFGTNTLSVTANAPYWNQTQLATTGTAANWTASGPTDSTLAGTLYSGGGTFTNKATFINGAQDVVGTFAPIYRGVAPETNTAIYIVNGISSATNNNTITGDPRGFYFDPMKATLVGGRFDLGQGTSNAVGTYLTMCGPQYGISWGWSQIARGTTNSAPADSIKGSVAIGYNGFIGATYDAVFGYQNAVQGSAGFAAGSQNIVGNSTASLTNAPIASHDTNAHSITLSGDRTVEFPVGAWVLVHQTRGSSDDANCLRSVTNSVFAAGNTTLTLDTSLAADYQAGTGSWVMNVTTPNNGFGAAVGQGNRVFGESSTAIGASNYLATTASGSLASGKYNSITGPGSAAIGTSNTLGNFNGAMALGTSGSVNRSYGTVLGLEASAGTYGSVAHAAGKFASIGDAQMVRSIARLSTTHSTTNWTNLWLNGSSERLTLLDGVVALIKADIVGSDAACTNVYSYSVSGLATRVGATIALYGATVTTNYESSANSCNARLVGNSSAVAVDVEVAGTNSWQLNWVASINATMLRR